jgi:hypothetical protein
MKAIRIISIVLLLLTGLNALIAGALFIFDPSGAKMGMSTAYLEFSPFSSFLIPGIVLFTVNGGLNLLAAGFTIREKKHYPRWVAFQGVLLAGWICVQVLMVRDINLLHITMFSIGACLTTLGLILNRFSGHQHGR